MGFRDTALLAALLWPLGAGAAPPPFEHRLTPQPVAEHTWMVEGRPEELSEDNGGDIANSAFIVTGHGVLVIDTGSTLAYGHALRAAIAGVTDQPVRWVLNTHHHPDHVFGNGAFPEAEIAALPGTRAAFRRHGEAFRDTLYQRLGDAARDTGLVPASVDLAAGERRFGGYPLRLLALRGHSGSDLAVLDPATGVLFTGDLVFHHRAPTTPHSPGIAVWRDDLATLAALDFKVLVPGHGPVARDPGPIAATDAWLAWLHRRLRAGAERGATANQVIDAPLPEAIAAWPLARYELTRSVSHFYADYERRYLWGEPAATTK